MRGQIQTQTFTQLVHPCSLGALKSEKRLDYQAEGQPVDTPSMVTFLITTMPFTSKWVGDLYGKAC